MGPDLARELTCPVLDENIGSLISIEISEIYNLSVGISQSDTFRDTGKLKGHNTLSHEHGEAPQKAPNPTHLRPVLLF